MHSKNNNEKRQLLYFSKFKNDMQYSNNVTYHLKVLSKLNFVIIGLINFNNFYINKLLYSLSPFFVRVNNMPMSPW